MVYCGKASQGCQSCRTRRIKCDRVTPDCSQCVRVGKKCPGYRDQLSLMFRDESSKVMQKAHAQWGVEVGIDISSTAGDVVNLDDYAQQVRSPPLALPSPPHSTSGPIIRARKPIGLRLQTPVLPNIEERGFHFYVNRYLVGHPDEPRNIQEVQSEEWLGNPALRGLMAAVGLASLSNLRGEEGLMPHARHRYGEALRAAGKMIRADDASSVDVTSRLVVMLALFETVKGVELSTGSVHAHVAGAAALIRTQFPMEHLPCRGVRPLLQLCFSTFISSFEAGIPLPALFYDWVTFCRNAMVIDDSPAIKLGLLVAHFTELSSNIRCSILTDGKPSTGLSIQALVDLDVEMANWEKSLRGPWQYRVEKRPNLPSAAVFQGEYHVYHDMWVARIWSHYRWARTLINEELLELVAKYPVSGTSFTQNARQGVWLRTILKLCRDTLVSTPSHWRHPLLNDKTPGSVEQYGSAGAGAAGIPIVLFHLKVAACAPEVPKSWWEWTKCVVECIWGDMGMLQAKTILKEMDVHREKLAREA